jgi:hypothetical protein
LYITLPRYWWISRGVKLHPSSLHASSVLFKPHFLRVSKSLGSTQLGIPFQHHHHTGTCGSVLKFGDQRRDALKVAEVATCPDQSIVAKFLDPLYIPETRQRAIRAWNTEDRRI